jgi:hypothetical protein
MKLLSSKITIFYKYILPAIWLAVLVYIVYASISTVGVEVFKTIFTVIFLFVLMLGFFILKEFHMGLVDEVWDGGDFLLVKNKGKEGKIYLTNIKNIKYGAISNIDKVTLTLDEPGIFGEKISYNARMSVNPFKRDPLVKMLEEKIYQKRSD